MGIVISPSLVPTLETYAGATAAQNTITVAAGITALTGLTTGPIVMEARPYVFEVYVPTLQSGVAGGSGSLFLYEDDAAIVAASNVFLQLVNSKYLGYIRRRFTPTAGTHTYDVRVQFLVNTGNVATGGERFLRVKAV